MKSRKKNIRMECDYYFLFVFFFLKFSCPFSSWRNISIMQAAFFARAGSLFSFFIKSSLYCSTSSFNFFLSSHFHFSWKCLSFGALMMHPIVMVQEIFSVQEKFCSGVLRWPHIAPCRSLLDPFLLVGPNRLYRHLLRWIRTRRFPVFEIILVILYEFFPCGYPPGMTNDLFRQVLVAGSINISTWAVKTLDIFFF